MHELKLIVDVFYEGGLTRMLKFVSETAQYGDFTRGSLVEDESTRARMQTVLEDIQNDRFARECAAEYAAGLPNYRRFVQADLDHPNDEVGARLHAKLPWLQDRSEAAGQPSLKKTR